MLVSVAPPLDPRSSTQLLWALGWWLRPLPQYTSLASQLVSRPTVTCDCSRSTKGRERNNLVQYAWFTGRLNASGQISISVHVQMFKKHNILNTTCYFPAICHCASIRGANADADANTWLTSEPIEQFVINCDEYMCCY